MNVLSKVALVTEAKPIPRIIIPKTVYAPVKSLKADVNEFPKCSPSLLTIIPTINA